MSKYEPLRRFLERQAADRVAMTFAEIEQLIGAALPRSKRYPAWWSNNPSNNPMTRIWLEAGFVTEQVEIGAERLTFRRAELHAPPGKARRLRLGAMRGTIQIAPGVDLTVPAEPDWGAVYE
jgi:hypothetical protein